MNVVCFSTSSWVGMVSLVEKATAGGLFDATLLPKMGSLGVSTGTLIATFNNKRDVRVMQAKLAELCADKERTLFLQGSYNPFVRTLPIPPLHININYLIDPRAMKFGLYYDKLYDEHVDGIASNRAAPLLIPGRTNLAFDPNDHAIPSEVKPPWWKVLYNFYVHDTMED